MYYYYVPYVFARLDYPLAMINSELIELIY